MNLKNYAPLRSSKYINFSKTIWILFYSLIFLLLLCNSFNYIDPDLGWHLKVGEQILSEKTVPSVEYYDYTLEGEKWVDHEWLINAISFFIYSNFGYITLNIVFALLVLTALIILTVYTKKYFLKKNKGSFLIMVFQFGGVLAMTPHLGIRMQEITLLNLLLLIIVLENFSRKKNTKKLLWLFPLFVFWANVHAGFLIGIFILFFYWTIKLIENCIEGFSFFYFLKNNRILSFKQLARSFVVFVSVAISTLLTPYGLGLYSFLKDYTNTFYLTHISEWLPAWHWPIFYKQMIYLAIFATILMLVFFALKENKNKYKIDLWNFMLALFFFALAFKSRRHFPLFFFASFPMLLQITSSIFVLPKKQVEKQKIYLFPKICVIAVFVGMSVLLFISTQFTSEPFSSPKFCQKYPCKAIKFIKDNPQYKNLKIFNSYGWGGFLIWVWPEKKLFIDGRLPQYPYNQHTLLEEYRLFFEEEKIEKKLNEHKIELVLLQKQEPIKFNWFEKYIFGVDEKKFNDKKNYLQEYLNDNYNWKLVYEDNISGVYILKLN